MKDNKSNLRKLVANLLILENSYKTIGRTRVGLGEKCQWMAIQS